MAFSFQALQPIITLLIEDLQISYARAGFLIGLFAFPGIFFSILAGHIGDKYGSKKILVISLLLMFSGSMAVAFGNTYYLIGLGRFMAGFGAMSTSIVGPVIISQWFIGKELGLAMSVFNTGVPLGVLISFNIMPRMAVAFGWRSSPLFTASFALMVLILFLLIFKERHTQKESQYQPVQKSDILKMGAGIWLIGLAWMSHTGSITSFLSFSTDFLAESHLAITVAGFSSSFVAIGNLIFTPFVGLLIDKFHAQKLFLALGGVMLATLYILIFNAPGLSMPLIFTLGLVSALIPASIFTLVPQYVSMNRMATAYGVISTSSNVGNAVSPYIAGFLRDITGSYKLSFWFLSFVAAGCTLATMALTLKKSRH